MTNEDHLARLKQGVEAWNSWRDEHPKIQPDLTEADLTGAHLYRAHLHDADLTEADLTEANLRMAALVQTTLKGAKLTRYFRSLRDTRELSKGDRIVDAEAPRLDHRPVRARA